MMKIKKYYLYNLNLKIYMMKILHISKYFKIMLMSFHLIFQFKFLNFNSLIIELQQLKMN